MMQSRSCNIEWKTIYDQHLSSINWYKKLFLYPITQFSWISLKKSKFSSLPFLDAEIRKLQYGTAATFGCIFLAKLYETPCLTYSDLQYTHIKPFLYPITQFSWISLKNKFSVLPFLDAEIKKLQYGTAATFWCIFFGKNEWKAMFNWHWI